MFGKVKKWLGIEGVKLELIIPEEVSRKSLKVSGKLRFQSMNPQTVSEIKVVMIEKYSRGKGKEKLTDEYELGSIQQKNSIEVPADEIVEVDFSLPFGLYQSDVDKMEESNFLLKGFARAAKFIRGAKSEYRLEAEAKVQGVALNPFDRKEIKMK